MNETTNLSAKTQFLTRPFVRLTLNGVDPAKVNNPVIRMLIEEDKGLCEGRRCPIAPDDEWLIFEGTLDKCSNYTLLMP